MITILYFLDLPRCKGVPKFTMVHIHFQSERVRTIEKQKKRKKKKRWSVTNNTVQYNHIYYKKNLMSNLFTRCLTKIQIYMKKFRMLRTSEIICYSAKTISPTIEYSTYVRTTVLVDQ